MPGRWKIPRLNPQQQVKSTIVSSSQENQKQSYVIIAIQQTRILKIQRIVQVACLRSFMERVHLSRERLWCEIKAWVNQVFFLHLSSTPSHRPINIKGFF